MNQMHLKFVCAELQLDAPVGLPTRVYGSRGGSLMWQVSTGQEKYVIKQLAPVIDLNNEKMVNKYELSEAIAHQFLQRGIPAVSAIPIERSGKHLVIVENTGYLIYPWVEGYTLGRNEISEKHAVNLVEILTKMHSINLNVSEVAVPRFDIHTNDRIVDVIERAASLQCSFAKMLKVSQGIILAANDSYQAIIPLLNENTIVTHRDLDQLNVLWNSADQPMLIDWESAGKMNPTREIVRSSLSWSGIGSKYFSMPVYTQMLRTYSKSGGQVNKNHMQAALYGMFGSMINWMLYNIELACNGGVLEEKDAATKEVNWVLKTMLRFKKLLPDLLNVTVES